MRVRAEILRHEFHGGCRRPGPRCRRPRSWTGSWRGASSIWLRRNGERLRSAHLAGGASVQPSSGHGIEGPVTSHRLFQLELADHSAGRLTGELVRSLEAHLEECDECREMAALFQEFGRTLREGGRTLFEAHPSPALLGDFVRGASAVFYLVRPSAPDVGDWWWNSAGGEARPPVSSLIETPARTVRRCGVMVISPSLRSVLKTPPDASASRLRG
jgi:hypothetical protein